MTQGPHKKRLANNKKATFNYLILNKLEAGIALLGSEVKSLRTHSGVSIDEAYVKYTDNELFLCNGYIAEFDKAHQQNHDVKRMRKLLCHRKQIKKIIDQIKLDRYTVIPTALYFNSRNIVKLEIAVAKGKKTHDKRCSIAEKDWQRDKQRMIKNQFR